MQCSQTFNLCWKQNWFVTFFFGHLHRPIVVQDGERDSVKQPYNGTAPKFVIVIVIAFSAIVALENTLCKPGENVNSCAAEAKALRLGSTKPQKSKPISYNYCHNIV